MNSPYLNNLIFKIFQISPEETQFLRRGFRITCHKTVERLESVGKNFLFGYHSALAAENTAALAKKLNLIEPFYRGFAFEGAAMSLALLDNLLFFRKKLLSEFLAGTGEAHVYMAHVGIGWAFARLPWFRFRILPTIANFDPLFKWLILDGFGFHEGYFHSSKYFRSNTSLNFLPGYALNAFVQGLGRSLWFVEGADAEKISGAIAEFPNSLRGDLWSGVGLACAYAGGISEAEIKKLKLAANAYLPNVAQGAAFAAKARQRAGNPSEQTELACRVFCCRASDEAALTTDEKLKNLPPDADVPAYEIWRRRIQNEFSRQEVQRV